jgi:hypothetical protein
MTFLTKMLFNKRFFRATPLNQVVFTVFIFLLAVDTAKAQDTIPPQPAVTSPLTVDSVAHSAHKATIYSLVLPGLGQAYNKKYWKIPIIYVGFGVLAYNFKINNDETRKFTEAYRYVINKDSFPTDNEYVIRYPDPNNLLQGRNFYRRRVELTLIFTAVWYILNVLDATVDAHFFDYDISDNLSLRVEPVFMMPSGRPDRYANGLRLSLNL